MKQSAGNTWRLLPEGQTNHHHVEEEEERHCSGEAGQEPAGWGPQLGVGVGGVGECGHRHEEDAPSQGDQTLLDRESQLQVSYFQ